MRKAAGQARRAPLSPAELAMHVQRVGVDSRTYERIAEVFARGTAVPDDAAAILLASFVSAKYEPIYVNEIKDRLKMIDASLYEQYAYKFADCAGCALVFGLDIPYDSSAESKSKLASEVSDDACASAEEDEAASRRYKKAKNLSEGPICTESLPQDPTARWGSKARKPRVKKRERRAARAAAAEQFRARQDSRRAKQERRKEFERLARDTG